MTTEIVKSENYRIISLVVNSVRSISEREAILKGKGFQIAERAMGSGGRLQVKVTKSKLDAVTENTITHLLLFYNHLNLDKMGKKLTYMTWEQLQKEMSIACDSAKVVKIGKQVDALIRPQLEWSNVTEIEMMELALKYVIANLRSDRLQIASKH